MENKEIVVSNTQIIHSVDDLSRIGKMMAVSGYFTDARDAAQAGVKIMAGMEMGFGAFASMTGIYIIQGKPSVGANLMASAVKNNPKYDYRVRKIEDSECKVEFFERVDGKWESIGISSFTSADAKRAGVKNMEKFSRNMLFARAMSNGIRWYCPDVFSGNPTYTPEELGASVDDEGYVTNIPQNTPETPEIVEAEVTPTVIPQTEETPAEAPEKPKFDAVAFLRNWQPDPTMKQMTIEEAFEVKNRDDVSYGKIETGKLVCMLKNLKKAMRDEADPQKYDVLMTKASAINKILTVKAEAQRKLDGLEK